MANQTQKIEEHTLKILKIVDESPSVKVFRVSLPTDAGIEFYAGQFFMVSFVEDSKIKDSRAYSIASSPMNKEYLEIALNRVGPFTIKLFQMAEGNLLKFKGPYGKFYFNEDLKNSLVLIGAGTGITPLMSLIRYCNDKKLINKVKFLYSVKTPSDIIYKNDLNKIKITNKNFDYAVTITRAEESHNWHGRKGRIDLEFLRENIDDIEGSVYYLCGSKEFVNSIIEMLESLGANKANIKTDIWG